MQEEINFGIRKAIKTSRHIIQEAKIQQINLKGPHGVLLEQVEEKVNPKVAELLRVHSDWIQDQRNKLRGVLTGYNDEEVFKVFEDGLKIFFKQQYRLFTHHQSKKKKTIPDNLQNEDYLRQQITAYAFDFIQSLKASQKKERPPFQALELAKLSYRHNPDVLQKLEQRYPDTDLQIIYRAVVGYPSRPEEFIEKYEEKIKELKEKYPELEIGVINHAAFHSFLEPEKFITSYKKMVEELQRKYPDVLESVIKHAALNHSTDADNFIETYVYNVKVLTTKYPDVPKRIIKIAARGRSKNPESLIEEYRSGKNFDETENMEDKDVA